MKYGINNWVYGGEPLDASFARLAAAGFDGIELKADLDECRPQDVCRLCAEYGLNVLSVLGWNIYPIPGRDLASGDPAERGEALSYMRKVIDFAAAVGAPIVLTLAFPAGRTAPLERPQGEEAYFRAAAAEWGRAVDAVQQLAAYAAPRGITLAVEPINRFETYALTTAADALRFLDDVGAENVGINLDTFHMNIDEADLPGAVRKVGERLAHMHLADSNRQIPGRGHVDFRAVYAALREVGFNGALVLEAVPGGAADAGVAIGMRANVVRREADAREALAYLKGIEAETAS